MPARDPLRTALPKWPGLLVRGRSVTPAQAAAILVRTDTFRLDGNDDAFRRRLLREIDADDRGPFRFTTDFEAVDRARRKYRVLDLAFLANEMILTCWVGGPHGWCDWKGRIAARTYNVGKRPTAKAVLAEWQTIAAAFPFLSLRSQLLSDEIEQPGAKPLVEFAVEDGRAEVLPPGEPLFDLAEARAEAERVETAFWQTLDDAREAGCGVRKFRSALALALASNRPARRTARPTRA